MLKFYYNPAYKYTNRVIIDVTGDTDYTSHYYENIDSPDTINGHIIYILGENETLPTYIVDTVSGWRWFVTGITQLRTGKFQISLLRDIISESPDTWKQEQAYITAGTATNYNKYKRWNLPYTNTKIKEEKLTINGKSSFFVFYVNEQNIASNVLSESDLNIKYAAVPGITSFDYTVTDLSEIPNYQYLNAGQVLNWTVPDGIVNMKVLDQSLNHNPYIVQYHLNGIYSDTVNNDLLYYLTSDIIGDQISVNINNCRTDMKTAIGNYVSSYQAGLGTSISNAAISSLQPYVGKVIHNTTTNKVYRINLTTKNMQFNYPSAPATLYSALSNISWPNGRTISAQTGNWFTFHSQAVGYTYTLEEIGTATVFDFNFAADTRKLPKSAVRCVNIVSDSDHNDEEIIQCLMLAQTNGNIGDDSGNPLTTGRILDIQYLPFSIATSKNADLKINNISLTAEFLEFDDFQYDINLTDLTDINKETDTIKIVSPSRATQYLFRPYDNDGNMEFAAKITLKPYTSTIYIRPSTKGLLIYDWDDKDCMIIQEDFSLTNVNSEWTQYVYNNRNYLNTFERQIQGREYERSWERQVEQANAKADEWNAKNLSAQKVQTMTGNIPIISGIMGAMATNWPDKDYMNAAQLDRQYNEAMYQEGLSLSRDLFQYQLDNIKSQPLIPSKVTTIDCKFLDGIYLEYYSTNQTELISIRNFYKYNGNRIDDYGSFNDYWGSFVRGKIIISMNYTQPEIDELNRRLGMGIFTGGIL